MSMVKEFREFAMRGNVLDLAIGVVIGAAFGKIVSSVVADVVTPILGLLIGGVDFSDLAITLKAAIPETAAEAAKPAVLLSYGKFIQTIFDFTIIAFAIFLLIKGVNRLKRKHEAAPPPPPGPTAEEQLLTEIRDLLKAK